jgi:hypothetical protein
LLSSASELRYRKRFEAVKRSGTDAKNLSTTGKEQVKARTPN